MQKLLTLWEQHLKIRSESIPLVASENGVSLLVRSLMFSDFGSRYYIPRQDNQTGSWEYPKQEVVGALIEYARDLAVKVFKGSSASLSALSGNQCVAGILFGFTKSGDKVIGIGPAEGGHWALTKLAERLDVHVHYAPFDYKTHQIDLNKLAELVNTTKPRFIMLDASHTLFPYPVKEICEIIGHTPLFYDVSHTFGIIAGQALPNPLMQGASCIHGSTHKSMFGPQKGLLVFNDDEIFKTVEGALHPILASNVHLDHIAALAAALEELVEFGAEYADKVVSNARHLASCLAKLGLELPYPNRGFTETHQVWIPLNDKVRADELFQQLQECGILVNLVELPFGLGLGLRLGTSEITRLGYCTSDIELIATLIANLILRRSSLDSTNSEVLRLARKYNFYHFCHSSERLSEEFDQLQTALRRVDRF